MTPQTFERPAVGRPVDDAEVADAALDKPYAAPEVTSFALDGLTVRDGDALTANASA